MSNKKRTRKVKNRAREQFMQLPLEQKLNKYFNLAPSQHCAIFAGKEVGYGR